MKYYADLLWPAAAGSVLWVLVSMLVNLADRPRDPGEILLVATIALYILANWERKAGMGYALRALDHLFDAPHLLLLTWTVLAADANEPTQLAWACTLMLAWVGLGHISRYSDSRSGYTKSVRLALGAAMIVVSGVTAFHCYDGWENAYPTLILPPDKTTFVATILFIVVVVWAGFQIAGQSRASGEGQI